MERYHDFLVRKATRKSYFRGHCPEKNVNFHFNNKILNLQEDGNPTKFRIENTWGDDRGDKGYYQCTSEWFHEFVFEAVIDKKYVPDDVLAIFNQEPIVLPAWDPMGCLAR